MTEIWFPGVHGDIGGGYWHDGLSDATLAFMADRCQRALRSDLAMVDAPTAAQLRAEDGTAVTDDDIAIEPRFDAQIHAHTGIESTLFDRNAREIQVAGQEDTRPVLHYSVKLRTDRVPDYRPAALRNLDFQLWLGDGRLSPPIHGIRGLRRYRLPWLWRLRNANP